MNNNITPSTLALSRSQANLERARLTLARGVSSGMRAAARPAPIYVERGFGPRFLDVDGNEFIDHCLAWGPLILGHAHPVINEFVSRQLDRGYTYGAQCELEFQVAEKINGLVPCAERVLFSNTGTEAVQAALRIARAATGRATVIKFEGHYHGWLDSVLVSYHPSAEQFGPIDRPRVVPTSGGQMPSAYSDTVVLQWNDAKSVENYLAEHEGEVAAILTEPILCNSGCILPKPGYLESLRQLSNRAGTVLIFDEVITGFRVSLGGAGQLFGVKPDIAVFGKAVGGGFPFSVIAGREDLIREVDAGRVVHAGTLNGNPIVLSAALATLNTLAQDDGKTLEQANQYGMRVMKHLRTLSEKHEIPLQVLGHGTVFRPLVGNSGAIKTYRDYAISDMEAGQCLVVELFNRGVYCVPDGRWYVSGVHADSELEYVFEAVTTAMKNLSQSYHQEKRSQL
jgi:glutamate-1-semialdehyde 2,1-aminomutase